MAASSASETSPRNPERSPDRPHSSPACTPCSHLGCPQSPRHTSFRRPSPLSSRSCTPWYARLSYARQGPSRPASPHRRHAARDSPSPAEIDSLPHPHTENPSFHLTPPPQHPHPSPCTLPRKDGFSEWE